IASGRLAAIGTPLELTQHAAADEIWFSTAPGLDRSALARALAVAADAISEERPGEYLVRAASTPTRLADLACYLRDENVTLAARQAGRRTLEEVFLQITAEEPA